MQPQIVGRLRSVAGDLGPSRLGFSEGQVSAPAETKAAASAGSDNTTGLDPELTAAAERIADAELRELFPGRRRPLPVRRAGDPEAKETTMRGR